MATDSRIKRKAKKRPTSMKDIEAGVKSGHETLLKILAKADTDTCEEDAKKKS